MSPQQAISQLPSGRYAVGVSGGADSIALLHLLHHRAQQSHDLHLHIVHLNHETRGVESDGDAEFVNQLATHNALPITTARLHQILPLMRDHSTNASAMYREARLTLFRKTCDEHALAGVILAHHLDDQAETILLRLLQSAEPLGLCGMNSVTEINGLHIHRPLLPVTRQSLRDFLAENNHTWREDASNQSDQYHRNEIRKWIGHHPQLTDLLIDLGSTCRNWKSFLDVTSPTLDESFPTARIANLPAPLAIHAIRRWLHGHGMEDRRASRDVINRVIDMATDQATGHRQQFPGPMTIRRKQGMMFVEHD